jgi:hypothetical protein
MLPIKNVTGPDNSAVPCRATTRSQKAQAYQELNTVLRKMLDPDTGSATPVEPSLHRKLWISLHSALGSNPARSIRPDQAVFWVQARSALTSAFAVSIKLAHDGGNSDFCWFFLRRGGFHTLP